MVNFKKNARNRIRHTFWFFSSFFFFLFSFKWLTHTFEKAKGTKICKTILTMFFGAWGFLLIVEKVYLVSQCHVKKIAMKFVKKKFQQIVFSFFFHELWLCFVIQKTKNLWGFIFFIFLRLNVAKYVLKNCKVEIINPLQNKSNAAKTKNTL